MYAVPFLLLLRVPPAGHSSPVHRAVTWRVTGGRIDSSGRNTPLPMPGRFLVIATEPISGKADTALVTVAASLTPDRRRPVEICSAIDLFTKTRRCRQVFGGRDAAANTPPTVAPRRIGFAESLLRQIRGGPLLAFLVAVGATASWHSKRSMPHKYATSTTGRSAAPKVCGAT